MGEEGIGGELGELAAPEVGAQDALGRHPLGVDDGEGLDGTGILAADQHPIGGFEIADGGAFCQELMVGEHREGLAAGGRLCFCCREDGSDRLGGAHRQGALLHHGIQAGFDDRQADDIGIGWDSARSQLRPAPAKWVGATEAISCLERSHRHEMQPISFNQPLSRLIGLWRARQFVGYVGEESPVEGAWFEEEKSSCSKRAILSLLSCSSFKRFSLLSDSILSCFVRCSMS